jgi:hypothetical protein
VTGRFWSRALVEPMKDIQVAFNKRRMQTFDIIDKGQPAVFVERDSRARKRTDLAMEMIELDKSERAPVVFQGVNPGDWMYRDMDELRNDLQHATGVRSPTMGENPANVNTYSSSLSLREADQVKRQPVVMERRLAIRQMVEDMVYDMRTYWGPEKQLRLAGDDDRMQGEIFNATRIPTFFIVQTAKGSPKPRTQAAMLKMIEDIWNGAINSQQPLPLELVEGLVRGRRTGCFACAAGERAVRQSTDGEPPTPAGGAGHAGVLRPARSPHPHPPDRADPG